MAPGPASSSSLLARWLGLGPPSRPARGWHVSPPVDVAAYGFGWLAVLVPLELSGATRPTDRLGLLLLVIGLTFVHRHYTLPLVYLDGEVFRRWRGRATWFPLLMLVGFAASPFLWRTPARLAVAGVVFAAGLWNAWHVAMQKYGILRLYAAKGESDPPTPGWVDRLLLLAWLPLLVVWLLPRHRAELLRYFPTVRDVAVPLVDAVERAGPWLAAPAAGLVALAVGLFLAYEWRRSRWSNRPRLVMAAGTSGLFSTFLWCHPVNAALAFAFSHAVEYIVFVWAYQRRRYHRPLPHDPPLGRILRRPALAYGLFTVLLGGGYLLVRYWGILIYPEGANPVLLGTPAERWAFYWSVYQSMVHFYFDGFLWKMRSVAVRAAL